MFTVTGYFDGVPYLVDVGPEVTSMDHMAADGSPHVLGMLMARRGMPWDATPTGPSGTLDVTDPQSILGALLDWTTVRNVTGDVPAVMGWRPVLEPGVVY